MSHILCASYFKIVLKILDTRGRFLKISKFNLPLGLCFDWIFWLKSVHRSLLAKFVSNFLHWEYVKKSLANGKLYISFIVHCAEIESGFQIQQIIQYFIDRMTNPANMGHIVRCLSTPVVQ
jgi:hypothetical protein